MSEYLRDQQPTEADATNTYSSEEITTQQLNNWAIEVNQNRDEAAFEQLYNYFFPKLTSFVLRWIRTNRFPNKDQIAEDISQMVLLRYWKLPPKFTSIHIVSYLYTTAKNMVYNYTRNSKKINYSVTVSNMTRYIDPSMLNPETLVILMEDLAENQKRLLAAFPQLTPFNQAIILERLKEKSYLEISNESQQTGSPLTENAAKQRHQRAVEHLRKLLTST